MNRRRFLELAGLGAVGSIMSGPPPLQLDRVGLQLYTVRDLMQASVPATLDQVARIGYKEVEFAGYFGAKPAQLRRWLDGLGLTSPAAHVPLLDDELAAMFDVAAEVGHRYLVQASVSPEQQTSVDGFRRVAASLNWAGQAARARGLGVAYHNHDFEFRPIGGIVPYDVLLAETDPSLVWMELDLYWITKAKRDPRRYFAAHPGRFRLCHVKDIGADGEIADVGQGRLDLQAILRQRGQAGLRHFFVEHDHPRDPLSSIAASYRFLERLLR